MDTYFKFSVITSLVLLSIFAFLESLLAFIQQGIFMFDVRLLPIIIYIVVWSYIVKKLHTWISQKQWSPIIRIYLYLITWFVYIWGPYAYYDFFLTTGWFSGMAAIVFGIGGIVGVLIVGPLTLFAMRHETNSVSRWFMVTGRSVLVLLSLIVPSLVTLRYIPELFHVDDASIQLQVQHGENQ